MKKVITYGTYDLFHYGHQRLLERAKKLGDYLIVGVTTDDFDKKRGKINVQQSLMERIESVKATGLADEIIVEEYEGQKIRTLLQNAETIRLVNDKKEAVSVVDVKVGDKILAYFTTGARHFGMAIEEQIIEK